MKWLIRLSVAVAIVALIVIFWDWNWFRGLAEREASAKAGRPVQFGNFDVALRHWQPELIFDRVVIGNPPGGHFDQPLMRIERLSVRVEPWTLLHGGLDLPEIVIDHPNGWLEQPAEGDANWVFKSADGKPASAPSGSLPRIGSLTITDGQIRFIDPRLSTDENLTVRTLNDPAFGGPTIAIDGKGTYNKAVETFRFRGGSVLSVAGQDRPYPLDVTAVFGDTKTHLHGTVSRPLEMSGFKADLDLSGPDLSSLFPLTGIALPPTPPYDLHGELTFVGHVFEFHKFGGTLGSSDLGGTLSFEPAHDDRKLPMLIADLTSKKIVLADLRGFIGAPPGKADAANATPARKAEAAAEARSGRILPTTTLDFAKLHAMNADVHYHGDHIESQSTPLDNLDARLTLRDGRLQLLPLTFGVGTGSIKIDLDIDSSVNPAAVDADADFRGVQLSRLMQDTKLFDGVGRIGGSGILKTRGNSMAEMFGAGNGNLKLFMGAGQISQLLVAIGKIDVLQTLGLVSKVEKPDRPNGNTDIRCLIGDTTLKNGTLKLDTFLVDTTSTLFNLTGTANMKNETLDLVFTPEPKTVGIGTYRPPFLIKGTFADPSVYPEPVETSARVGASIVLGIIATPLAALLPSITLGLGEDANCTGLVQQAQRAAAQNDATSPAKRAEEHAKPHPKAEAAARTGGH